MVLDAAADEETAADEEAAADEETAADEEAAAEDETAADETAAFDSWLADVTNVVVMLPVWLWPSSSWSWSA